jgi:hypothetical protein
MEWSSYPDWARFDVDLAARYALISYSDPAGDQKMMLAPRAMIEVDR